MYGIMVKKKRRPGNKAIKKLKLKLAALVLKLPSDMALINTLITSHKVIPSKKGTGTLPDQRMNEMEMERQILIRNFN